MGDDVTIGEVGRICARIDANVERLDAKVDGVSERLAVLEATRPGTGKVGLTATGALGAGVAIVGEWLWTKISGHGP